MLIQADARQIPLIDGCVQCVVTSPPYWQLRNYGVDGQIGMELEPAEYVAEMVDVFREVKRVLRDDGSLWLNLGDTYAASGKGGGGSRGDRTNWRSIAGRSGFRTPPVGYKFKDITNVPFDVARALREDGWYYRSVIIWAKPSAVEPLRLDRPATAHEYVLLFTKCEQSSIRNPGERWFGSTVWTITTDSDASHQAQMPSELVRRCIVSSTGPRDLVFDPFIGSGTVGSVAERLNRKWIGVDLNPAYHLLAKDRTAQRGLRFTAESA